MELAEEEATTHHGTRSVDWVDFSRHNLHGLGLTTQEVAIIREVFFLNHGGKK